MQKNLIPCIAPKYACFLAVLLPVLSVFITTVRASDNYCIAFPNDRILTCDPSVADTVKPTVVCKDVGAYICGFAYLGVQDFIASASDDCTPFDQLQFALATPEEERLGFPLDYETNHPVSYLSFTTCALGPNVVQVWVKDAAGNTSVCHSLLLLQEVPYCYVDCYNTRKISGIVETEDGHRLGGVSFRLRQKKPRLGAPILEYLHSKSNPGGFFVDYRYVPVDTLLISPELNENHLNGVTTHDIALITRHILNIEPFQSPYQMIAADVNRSGNITVLDVIALRQLILGITDTFPNNKSWRFIDKSYIFPNSGNPFQGPDAFPEYAISDYSAKNIHFIGIKVGDVNNSVNTTFYSAKTKAPLRPVRTGSTGKPDILKKE